MRGRHQDRISRKGAWALLEPFRGQIRGPNEGLIFWGFLLGIDTAVVPGGGILWGWTRW